MRLQKIRKHIITILNDKFDDSSFYHGVSHSLDVEAACVLICENDNEISDLELELLQVAALSHDIGISEKRDGHEKLGCKIVSCFLPNFGYSIEEIEQIKKLILATKFPHNPISKLEEIICDSDLAYIGVGDYSVEAIKLKKELEEAHSCIFETELMWLKYQLDFLNNHQFFTEYAKSNFNPKKKNIILHLEQEISKE